MGSILVRPLRFVVPALMAVAFGVGCTSQDDSSNPAGVGDGDGDVSQQDLQISGLEVMGFVNEFVTEVENLATADFAEVSLDFGLSSGPAANAGGPSYLRELPIDTPRPLALRAQEDIVCDELTGTWVMEVTETEVTEDGTATVSVYFAVQYLTEDGTPQVGPDELTDTMTLVAEFDLTMSGSDAESEFDITFDYDTNMSVSNLQTGPYEVEGGGSMDMDWHVAGDGLVLDLDLAMSWLMDVTAPIDGSCPTGIVTVDMSGGGSDAYSLTGSYDGTDEFDWTLYEDGVAIDSGSDTLDCTTPPSS